MRSVARLEVTEEDPAQHADDGRPSGNHVDLKHLTAFMNSQEVFFFPSRSQYLVVFGKLLKDGSFKVCLQVAKDSRLTGGGINQKRVRMIEQ